MANTIEKVRDWVGERGVPFQPQLARVSDRLDGWSNQFDEWQQRRKEKKADDEHAGSDDGGREQGARSPSDSES